MKKIFLMIILLLFSCSPVICGDLQVAYEQTNSKKYKIFYKHNVSYILQKDLKNYKSGRKSIYGKLIDLFDNSDERNYDYLLQMKNNFKLCSQDIKCWKYIEVDDYRYNWLDDDTKSIILFNNMIFLYK